jgi:hypothetical protein
MKGPIMLFMGIVIDPECQQTLLVRKEISGPLHGLYCGIVAEGEAGSGPVLLSNAATDVNLTIPPEAWTHRITYAGCDYFLAHVSIGAAARKNAMSEHVFKLSPDLNLNREPVYPPLRWILPTLRETSANEAITIHNP